MCLLLGLFINIISFPSSSAFSTNQKFPFYAETGEQSPLVFNKSGSKSNNCKEIGKVCSCVV